MPRAAHQVLPHQPLRLPGAHAVQRMQPTPHAALGQHGQHIAVDQTPSQHNALLGRPQHQIAFGVGVAHVVHLPASAASLHPLPVLQHLGGQHDAGAARGLFAQIVLQGRQAIGAALAHGLLGAESGGHNHPHTRTYGHNRCSSALCGFDLGHIGRRLRHPGRIGQHLLGMRMGVDQPRDRRCGVAAFQVFLQGLPNAIGRPGVDDRHIGVLPQHHRGGRVRAPIWRDRMPLPMHHRHPRQHRLPKQRGRVGAWRSPSGPGQQGPAASHDPANLGPAHAQHLCQARPLTCSILEQVQAPASPVCRILG